MGELTCTFKIWGKRNFLKGWYTLSKESLQWSNSYKGPFEDNCQHLIMVSEFNQEYYINIKFSDYAHWTVVM